MGLLQLLAKLFGKSYLNKIMGTRTNVAKPVRMDINSPFKKYSDEAYEDQKNIDTIEQKINEYGPYALSNKNPQELANFEANAKRLLQAKMRQGGVTENMIRTVEEAKKPKPEAEIIDMATQQKVDDTGIMKLKTDLGLPEGVDPNSPMGEMLSSTNRMNKLSKDIDTKAESAGDIFMDLMKSSAPPINREKVSLVRTAAREFLNRELKLGKIKLKPNETKSILQPSGSGIDPIDTLRTYYGEDALEAFDGIANKFMNTEKYSDFNKIIDENIDPSFLKPRKDPTIKQSFTDKEMKDIVDEAEKDLGDRLKDLPDDIDPDALANGGRPGYALGSAKALITFLIDTLVKKKKFDPGLLKRVSEQKNGEKLIQELYEKEIGKVPLTTADKAPIPESTVTKNMFEDFNKRNRKLTKSELEDFENEIGDSLEAYDFDGTAVDAERILKEQEAYKAEMFAEYKAGKLNPDESLAKAMDEVGGSASGDMKYDANILADELAFQRGLIPEGGDITDIADQRKQMDLYDEAYSALSGQFLKNREQLKKMQQFSEPTQTLKSIKEKGAIDISDPTIADEINTFLRENDPEAYKNLEQKIQLDNFDPKDRKLNASGGLNYLMGL